MSELVIVIADLYLGAEPEAAPAARGTLPALEALSRFAHVRAVEGSWRSWAAQWLGLARHAALPPASVAAAVAEAALGPAVWLAEPLSLTEGVGRVLLERRGRLRLEAAEAARLAEDFNALYSGSGLALTVLPGGTLLLSAPSGAAASTCDPARLPAAALAERLPGGPGAPALRRLGSELEMWLHSHRLNAERAARGAAPVSQLWIWGGGMAPAVPRPGEVLRGEVYGSGAYLAGLARLGGSACRALPPRLPEPPAPAPGRALYVLEVSEALQRLPRADLLGALGTLEEEWIGPALTAVRRGSLERLWLLANDRAWCLRPRDLWRRWRRSRAGLESLT